jgi:hypothetical protein
MESFFSIIQSQSIRLSSLDLSNDYEEGRLVKKLLHSYPQRHEISDERKLDAFEFLDMYENTVTALGFCLSEVGDLLSQWRGYANDGKGVAIGFNKEYLEALWNNLKVETSRPYELRKISYTENSRSELLEKEFDLFLKRSDIPLLALEERTPDYLKKISEVSILEIAKKTYEIKSDAFKEEREWRLLLTLVKKEPGAYEFRATPTHLIPFKTIHLSKIENLRMIDEVILGPKNTTPEYVIESFLDQKEFENAQIFRSRATYR